MPPGSCQISDGDEIGELPCRLEGLPAARLDDGARDRAGAALLAVVVEDVGEFRFRRLVDEVGGARALALHAHVERAVAAEREAALRLVELHGGDADVEHDAVDAAWLLRRARCSSRSPKRPGTRVSRPF